jgi:hypothetical protein
VALLSIAARFMLRFAGLERAHGTYEIGAGTRADAKNKLKGKALTKLESVTPELWEAHLAGKYGLGIVPIRDDASCVFGAIDIDVYDDFDLPALEAKCLALKLPLVPCRTKSGGAHLYLFAAEPLTAAEIRGALVEWASALGYPKVEVFPKQVQMASPNDIGNWINMPYFDAERTTRYAIQGGKAISAEQFLQLAQQRAVTREQLETIAVVPTLGLEDGPPCLQFLAREGFGEGNRNNGLFNLGVYCRLRSNADGQWLQGGETWESAAHAMNEQFMQPPLNKREAKEVISSIRRKAYFYLCNMPPISSCCNKDICRQRRYGIGNGHADSDPGAASFVLDNPRRVLTEPVTWIVTINAVDMEVTTEELMDQRLFRKKAIEKLKLHLPPLKGKSWEPMIKRIVEEAQDVQAPADAGPEGRLMIMLEDFCTNHAEAKAKDELLLGRPWNEDERTMFRGKDFMRYLDQHHFRALNERAAWAVLRRNGALHDTVKLKGKTLTVWSVPAFARQTEDFDKVRVSAEEF